jgi:hypothetical protein
MYFVCFSDEKIEISSMVNAEKKKSSIGVFKNKWNRR